MPGPFLVRGALFGREPVQHPLGGREFAPHGRLVPGQFRLPVLQALHPLARLRPQPADLHQLLVHPGDRGGLPLTRAFGEGGPLQVLVGVGGERQLNGGVDASGAVLGGGDRTERVAGGVEAVGPAGGLVAQPVHRCTRRRGPLLGPVVLLRGHLRLLVQLVRLVLDLGRRESGFRVADSVEGGRGRRSCEREGGGGTGGGPGEEMLLGFPVRGHGCVYVLPSSLRVRVRRRPAQGSGPPPDLSA